MSRHHAHRVVLDEHVADLDQLLDGAVALLRPDFGDDGAAIAAQAVEERVAVPGVPCGVFVHVPAGHVAKPGDELLVGAATARSRECS